MAKGDAERRNVASDALENLVGQFSSKYDCFRELVQNSIDAGSQLIEVWTEFVPDGKGSGTATIHIDDDGEGMDRAIINGQLTKLFSSRKEGDLTKIGKFGIGFVSIFALEPEAVLIHTGRGGEYWEVLFHEDRSFQLKELDTPTEGTQISMFLKVTQAAYEEIVVETHRALSHWCSHSETEITFEDRYDEDGELREISQPFEVQGELMVRHEVPGTEIVAAYAASPIYGFYNRGLALYLGNDPVAALGDRADRFKHISFKVKSRYLEHTLSRETVVMDEHYEKAMKMLEDVVNGKLLDGLVSALEEQASRAFAERNRSRVRLLSGYLTSEPPSTFERMLDRKVLSAHHSPPLSAREALARVGYSKSGPHIIYACEEPSSVTQSASEWVTSFVADPLRSPQGLTETALLLKSLHAAHVDKHGGFLRRLFGRKRQAPHRLMDPRNAFFVVEKVDPSDVQQHLLQLTRNTLLRLELDELDLSWVRLSGDSPPPDPPAVVSFRTETVAEPMDLSQSISGKSVGLLESHSFLGGLIRLAETRPELAAFFLAQRLVLTNLSDEPSALGLAETLTTEVIHG